jgi:hypothetical protein
MSFSASGRAALSAATQPRCKIAHPGHSPNPARARIITPRGRSDEGPTPPGRDLLLHRLGRPGHVSTERAEIGRPGWRPPGDDASPILLIGFTLNEIKFFQPIQRPCDGGL